MSLEKEKDFFGISKEEAEKHKDNIQKFLDMEEAEEGNPDRFPLAELKKMRHLDPDTVANGPWPLGRDFPAKEEFEKAGLMDKEEDIGDLATVLNGQSEKIVPFNSKRVENIFENNETGAITEKALVELSEKYRHYLSLPFNDRKKGLAFLEIQQTKELLKKVFGANDIVFGLDGDIFKVDAEGRKENIYDNPGLPVENANAESPTDKISTLLNEELKERQEILPAGEKSLEKNFYAENFNIPEPFTNIEAARDLAAQSGYLDLSQVPSFSLEILSILQEREGIISLVGLRPENINEATAAVLKKFKSTIYFNDAAYEKMEEFDSVSA